MTSIEPQKSVLHDVMEAAGCRFVAALGAWWPDTFGDPDAEYWTQREAVGVCDGSGVNKWDFRGPDAIVAAQRVHTNNITALPNGRVRYGAFCDDNGKVIDDGLVFRLADDHAWVMTNTSNLAQYFARGTNGLDVEIEFISPQLVDLWIQGPQSRDALARITDFDLSKLTYFSFTPQQVEVGGVPVWLSRTGVSGEIGYELFCRPPHAPELWEALVQDAGARPYGLRSVECTRIEIGALSWGYDYVAGTLTPYELSLERLVKLEQDFVGRTALLEASKTSPTKRLITLRIEGDVLPDYGSPLSHEGTRVGTLTSPTPSPKFGHIALAVVETRFTAPGTRLAVEPSESAQRPAFASPAVAIGHGLTEESTPIWAVVNELHPAYDPSKKRPRS